MPKFRDKDTKKSTGVLYQAKQDLAIYGSAGILFQPGKTRNCTPAELSAALKKENNRKKDKDNA